MTEVPEKRAIISGIGISDVGRRLGVPAVDLTAAASRQAIADAGLEASDIDGIATMGDTPVDEAAAVGWPYDAVYAAGSDVCERLAAILHRDVGLLPLACDPSVYRPQKARDQQVDERCQQQARQVQVPVRKGARARHAQLPQETAPSAAPRPAPYRGRAASGARN